MVRTRSIYAMTIHVSLVQAVASCGGFSRKLALWCCFDSKYGDKATLSLFLVAKDRENPVLGAKMPVVGRVTQVVA